MRIGAVAILLLAVLSAARVVHAGRPEPRQLRVRASASSNGGDVSVSAWDNGRGDRSQTVSFDDMDGSSSDQAPSSSRSDRQRDMPARDDSSEDDRWSWQPRSSKRQQQQQQQQRNTGNSWQQDQDQDQPSSEVTSEPDKQQPKEDQPSSAREADKQQPKDTQSNQVNDADLQSVLDIHNSFRARYGVPALSWSADIAANAQAYSKNCVFEHSHRSGVGENLSSGYKDWRAAIRAWMEDEERLYDFNRPGFSERTGHFTQVVWRSTTQLGCGSSPCGGRPLYVCQYAPPGNYAGQFEENVPKPSSS